jgi:hypothetical protein
VSEVPVTTCLPCLADAEYGVGNGPLVNHGHADLSRTGGRLLWDVHTISTGRLGYDS